MSFEGFRDVVNEIENQLAPAEIEVDGKTYLNRVVHLPPAEPQAKTIDVSNLSSFCEYAKEARDDIDNRAVMAHVFSHGCVRLLGALEGRHRRREVLVAAKLEGMTTVPHGEWMDPETFNITLRTRFVSGDGDFDTLLKTTSKVVASKVRDEATNQVAQEVSVRKGLSGEDWESLPTEVHLAPASSGFEEIVQPKRVFILRARPGRSEENPGTLALFEIETPWRQWCVQESAKYLKEHLPAGVPVLS